MKYEILMTLDARNVYKCRKLVDEALLPRPTSKNVVQDEFENLVYHIDANNLIKFLQVVSCYLDITTLDINKLN